MHGGTLATKVGQRNKVTFTARLTQWKALRYHFGLSHSSATTSPANYFGPGHCLNITVYNPGVGKN